MTLEIRPETPTDIPAIRALTEAAFLEAPHTSHTEHYIVDALRAPLRCRSWLWTEMSSWGTSRSLPLRFRMDPPAGSASDRSR